MISENQNDPVSQWIKASPAPKYILVLLTPDEIILFLRYALQYTKAECWKIKLKSIQTVTLKKSATESGLEILFNDGKSLDLPRMQLKNAEEILSAILALI